MNRIVAVVFVVLAAGAGLAISSQWGNGSWFSSDTPALGASKQGDETSTRGSRSKRAVVALGRLEPSGGVVEVSNDLIGDRLVSLAEEGTRVVQHEELGRLDETFRKTDVDLAAARYAEAEHHLEAERANAQVQLNNAMLASQQATEGAAIEIEAQEKRVELLRLEQQQAVNDVARTETLNQSRDSIVSAQDLEHQRLRRDKTAAEADAAEAELRRIKQATKFDRQTAEANVRAAEVALDSVDKRSTLESLKVQLRLAEERLGRTKITAPIAGTVLKRYMRPGESIAETPILQMADLSRFDCITEVFETDIHLVSIGDIAQVRSRAFRGPYEQTFVSGTVKRIGNAMPNRELTPLSPLEPVDKRVVQVVIDLSDNTDELAGLLTNDRNPGVHDKSQALVNLQVEVTFPADDSASGPEYGS